MIIQTISVRETLITLRTLVRSFPGVTSHMILEDMVVSKRRVAFSALIWPVSSVCPHMPFEMILTGVCLVTLRTRVWFVH